MATFGEVLRARRKELKMTQQELADKAGIVRQTVTMLEKDQIRRPASQMVINVARVLEMDPNSLFCLLEDVVMPFQPGGAAKAEIIAGLEKVRAEVTELIKAAKTL